MDIFKGTMEAFDRVGRAISDGDIGEAVLGTLDALSIGNAVADGTEAVLGAFGVELDEGIRESLELGVDLVTNPFAAAGSAIDLIAINQRKTGGAEIAQQFATMSPSAGRSRMEQGMSAKNVPKKGNFANDAARAANKAKAKGNAVDKAKAKAKAKGQALDQIAYRSALLQELAQLSHALGGDPGVQGNGYAKEGTSSDLLSRLKEGEASILKQLQSLNSPGDRMSALGPGATFEDVVNAFMMDSIDAKQQEVMDKIEEIQRREQEAAQLEGALAFLDAGGTVASLVASVAGTPLAGALVGMGVEAAKTFIKGEQAGLDAGSRATQSQELANLMNELQQMQSTLSNIMKAQHDAAMNSISNMR